MRFRSAFSSRRAAQDPTCSPAALSRIPIRAFHRLHKDAGLKFDGSKALPANLVRPFPGLGGIRFEENVATSNFNSLQVAVNRRFSRGFSYSIAYTWSKAMGVAAGDGRFCQPFQRPAL